MKVLEDIAKMLNKDKSQIKLCDISAKIPELKRKVESYRKEAVEAEAQSLAKRAKAFSPETPAADRASLMRHSGMDADKAKTLSGFASTLLAQLGNFEALETTMQIANEMKEVGLISPNVKAIDWQNAMDTMQVEIQQMITTTQKLGHVMTGALSPLNVNDSKSADIDDLEQLFNAWENEPDPVKKAEIQRQIELKTKVAYT